MEKKPIDHEPGWVFLDRHHDGGVTIRWRRRDREAYVLAGNKVGSRTTEGLLGTIPVPTTGWTDLAQIRLIAENWYTRINTHHADHLGDTIQSTAVRALAVRTRWSWNSACRN